MNVAGVDASSHAIDIVLLDETTDAAVWHRIPLTGATAFDRARSAQQALPRASWWDSVYLCGIEATFSVTFNAATALARVQGVLLAHIPPGVTVLPTSANEWQRVFLRLGPDERLGDRKARKAAVRRRCVELGFGDAPDLPQDCFDAYAIAWAAREINQAAIERSAA